LKIPPAQVADLGLKPLELQLEPPDVRGQVIELLLLLVSVGHPVESLLTEGLCKEPEEGMRAAEIGLVDLPVHGIRQLRGHDSPTSE
jgi:hypothetical protein